MKIVGWLGRGRLDQEEGLQVVERQKQALRNDARSTAELVKFKQVEHEPPAPSKRPHSSLRPAPTAAQEARIALDARRRRRS